ncbi:acyl carrier protein [Bacillus cereus]
MKEEQQELGSIKSYSSSNSIQDEKELKLLTTQFLKEIISKVSEIPIKNIKEKVPMDRYGLDSIIILKLGNELEEYFNNLPKSIFFEYQTITDLSGYLVENLKEELLSIFKLDGLSMMQGKRNNNKEDKSNDDTKKDVKSDKAKKYMEWIVNQENTNRQSMNQKK